MAKAAFVADRSGGGAPGGLGYAIVVQQGANVYVWSLHHEKANALRVLAGESLGAVEGAPDNSLLPAWRAAFHRFPDGLYSSEDGKIFLDGYDVYHAERAGSWM